LFERLVAASIRMRGAMLALLCMLLAAGAYATIRLPIDAMPDVTNVQVTVLTKTGGLSAVEAENVISVPIENALNGVPGMVELRSMSEASISSVTVVFRDGMDPWLARQLVGDRLRGIEKELPPTASTPELAPLCTALGEIFHFIVRSERHSPMQLRTLIDWDITPKLRGIPGIIEVNTQGGELKQYQVLVDRQRLTAHGLSLGQVANALRQANQNAGGGYVERGSERFIVRGDGLLKNEQEIGDVVLRVEPKKAPVLVRHVADVKVGPALRYGVITHRGKTEAVLGIVMMLYRSNSRDVVNMVGKRIEGIRKELPPGVELEVTYDRADFVARTIKTVMTNLAEGALIVMLMLALILGTVRGAVAVVLGIPVSMSIAIFGMHAMGVTGDLMSLGAIDFGFLVDGPIVILEAVVAATAGRQLVGAARAEKYDEIARLTTRPVGFAIAIIMLVYVPLLTLQGVEGKLFRPMALTMAMALFGALFYAVVIFPAVLVTLMPPTRKHGPAWVGKVAAAYGRVVPWAVSYRWYLLSAALVALVVIGWRFVAAGAEFVPRIFEGDAIVVIRRAPSIGLTRARDLELAAERVVQRFPEVQNTLGLTGRAEVAVAIMGNDATDIMTRLAPIETWKSAKDFDELSEKIKTAVENEVPGTYVSISQPIEDRTNEVLSGSRADVAVQIYGTDLNQLMKYAKEIQAVLKDIRGTGDLRVERILGQPVINAIADRRRMATYGVRLEDAFLVLTATREGVDLGNIYEGQKRFGLRLIEPPRTPTPEGLGELRVETMSGGSVRMSDVLTLNEDDGPALVRRTNRLRTMRVDANLRGRDLLSWVTEAQQKVGEKVSFGTGYHIEWGGQFENFTRAKERLKIVMPIVIGIIFGMLLMAFRSFKMALAVFATVPLSLTGGMLGMLLRDMPFSLSAAVGFIALGGVAVLNGVVMGQEILRRFASGVPAKEAVIEGSHHMVRAVLCTTAVAALGFLPMAISVGAGSEVQRPLATVVSIGITVGALTTLVVLPGIFAMLLRERRAQPRDPQAL
jgi:heavy metal efflux system protein